ncbi:ATPase, T2SS/T4P/T4SS family [Burkholderia vietnamiensis]|uniref:ATPase, T2SS/T4P/T4SS family n=1 Tax=Burkholderia vietnamiensis TaxID=60552 RepID=UPI001594D50B|nr:ATPase, T2SS/T4P/T4SS family [Burkholderia vietnamiensis]MCA8270705.1 Flp pilus assembly complex ATPase component TadA [Burkholderia vietnamiensis]
MGINESARVAPAAGIDMAPDLRFPVRPDCAEKVLLLTDGTLLVNRDYQTDLGVLSYMDQLRRVGVEFHEKEADHELIAKVAAGELHQKRTALSPDNSERQNEVLRIIRQAVADKASDIHFLNYENKTLVRWRVHGSLITRLQLLPEDGEALCRCMYDSMTDDARTSYLIREPQDGRLSRHFMKLAGLAGARIATRPMEYGNIVVLRLLYSHNQARVLTLQQAGYLDQQIVLLESMLRRKGIILFSGETGSGKSSSLAILLRMLLELFDNKINLLTIENPLEYVIDGAVQTILTGDLSTPEGISRAWAAAITNIVRLDIDYAMVGELRDLASAAAAVAAALTGHGMLSSIHAEEIFAILDRLTDFGIDERRLRNPKLFRGFINQSLAPILCTRCKVPFSTHYRDLDELTTERVHQFCTPESVYLRGKDDQCPECGGLGYVDRKLVAEVCVPNKALLDIYIAEGSASARSHWVNKMDGVTKNRHTIMRINAGTLDPFDGDTIVPLDEDSLTLTEIA